MQDPRLQQAQLYTEFSGLNALKTQARTDKQAALEQVARQFEGIFMSAMLKSMRQANEVFSEGNYLNSQQSRFYQDMFDSQLSLTMSSGQGMGLSEALVRQLGGQVAGVSEGSAPTGERRLSIMDYDRSLPALSRELPERLAAVTQIAEDAEVISKGRSEAAANALHADFTSPEEFVGRLLPLAERAAAGTGIDPKLMVAQAALETGWGRHMIEAPDGEPSFNLFGIKADQRWSGEHVNIATSEYRDGVRVTERAAFRRYEDFESSFRDYVAFLGDNPRYRDVLAVAGDPEQFAHRLQQAGYATDPNYANKILRIMAGDQLNNDQGATPLASLGTEG
ncbi:flagellar assembly peptidoglycan hydrolase FlgJ [Marinobacter zhejiangensis]|uniref:Peptidoglycan hydrolase FlgJ n=1 Tax=Marinobacter zhejiangensis TaxID=488535 RepID=A0A1I4P7N6_9GAMM|nr:flagellar assembly peptidoglycan hydrolase FlgJ [Marinobacter zhejiangensis]SFM23818.1 flagellar protein FlgJ [Marinobacter zhejiangensis]